MTAVYFLAVFILGFFTPTLILFCMEYYKARKFRNAHMPRKAESDKLCRGPHSWITAEANTNSGISDVKVCRACGFVSGTELMVSPDAIDRIEENNKIREIEGKLYKEFLNKEDNDIKKYFGEEIKNGVNFEKLTVLHAAGMTFGQRYTIYRTAKAEEIQEELTKDNA